MKILSLREQARAAGRTLNCPGGFEFGELSNLLEVKTREQEKRLRQAVTDLVQAGDLQRRDDDRLIFVERPAGAPGKEEMMWRFLRLNRQATVAQLLAVSGAAQDTVKNFCKRLEARGLAAKTADGFRLLTDPGPELPFDEARADRARVWRDKKQKALAALDQVYVSSLETMQKAAAARVAVSEMEEG